MTRGRRCRCRCLGCTGNQSRRTRKDEETIDLSHLNPPLRDCSARIVAHHRACAPARWRFDEHLLTFPAATPELHFTYPGWKEGPRCYYAVWPWLESRPCRTAMRPISSPDPISTDAPKCARMRLPWKRSALTPPLVMFCRSAHSTCCMPPPRRTSPGLPFFPGSTPLSGARMKPPKSCWVSSRMPGAFCWICPPAHPSYSRRRRSLPSCGRWRPSCRLTNRPCWRMPVASPYGGPGSASAECAGSQRGRCAAAMCCAVRIRRHPMTSFRGWTPPSSWM